MTDRQRNGFILLLVVGLILASLGRDRRIPGHQDKKTASGSTSRAASSSIYQGQPTAQTPVVTQDALPRAVDIMRQRVDQLGVSEPEIQTSGGNQISVGLPDVKNTARAEKLVGHDRAAGVLRLGGQRAHAQWQDGRQPAPDPGSDGADDQPGLAERRRRGTRARAAWRSTTRSSWRPSSPRRPAPTTRAQRPASTTCSARRAARPAQAAAKANGTRPSSGRSTACSPALTTTEAGPARTGLPTGVSASDGQMLDGPARDRRAAGGRRPASPSRRRFDDPTAQFFVLRDHVVAVRQRHHQPAAEHRPERAARRARSASPRSGKNAFQNVTGDDRPPRPAGQQPVRPAAQPALRGRAGQPADHGPVDRLQAVPRRDPGGQRRRHHRRVHDPAPRRTWPPSCGSARCRSS